MYALQNLICLKLPMLFDFLFRMREKVGYFFEYFYRDPMVYFYFWDLDTQMNIMLQKSRNFLLFSHYLRHFLRILVFKITIFQLFINFISFYLKHIAIQLIVRPQVIKFYITFLKDFFPNYPIIFVFWNISISTTETYRILIGVFVSFIVMRAISII